MAQAFIIGFLVILIGYSVVSSFLQYLFFVYKARDVQDWKIQPLNDDSLLETSTWIPMLCKSNLKKKRAKNHKLLASINLMIASTFSGFTFQAIFDGNSRVSLSQNSIITFSIKLKIERHTESRTRSHIITLTVQLDHQCNVGY